MDKILIIDLHNFIYRGLAFIKSKPEDPEETKQKAKNALIYSFFTNLRATVEQFTPQKIFCVLEGRPQFRYDLYPEYKGNRIIKTGSSSKQLVEESHPEIVNLLSYLPITLVQAEKYEADDVINTLAENLKDEDVTVVSGDSDFTQLLQKNYTNFKLYNAIKKAYVEPPEYPYVYWKCLNGDSSDNISGVVSKAKALKAMKDTKLLEDIMSIEENRAKFNINKQLIEFRHVPEEELIISDGVTNFEVLQEEFKSREFESILKEPRWSKFKDTFKDIKY